MDLCGRRASHRRLLRRHVQEMVDLGNMWGIEVVVIDENTKIEQFKKDLMWADVVWKNKR